MNVKQVDELCIYCAICSHNNSFLNYVLEHDLYEDLYKTSLAEIIRMTPVFDSQNVGAVFLLYEKDKNIVFPWCAAFPQTYDIIKNDMILINTDTRFSKSPLHYAAIFNCAENCKLLLDNLVVNRIDINETDGNRRTALNYAVKYDSKEVAELLISYGADVNLCNKYSNILIDAITNENKEMVDLLVSNGADVNFIGDDGHFPLHQAVKVCSREIIKLLIEHGANVSAIYKSKGTMKTAIHFAVENLISEDNDKDIISKLKEIIEFLISNGADINAKVRNGTTPLHIAAKNLHKDAIEFLISHGADFNSSDDFGKTAFHYAVTEILNTSSFCKRINKSEGIKIRNSVVEIQNYAIDKNYLELIEFFVSHGADVNAKDCSGKSVLQIAKENYRNEIVQLLIAHGPEHYKNNL
ncbi:ankyrin repeat protein, putative [Trichomonas vaginalis G3]|uniref:Ankyrin repeat protein, putative n=1 Tax=Trichomonas vaginalis (strain ATCC PRA-98 / G3) TaxID=412133 RepID=A2F810_TRIV3|nr:spectrin binding [Trichomonas vaginalis G3]EAX98942.1 ankyrin repeat protein, putative [Trichomonas vaginalis G3]KAI5533492.1 spectrin binding [Trichomonas vaginalis G3]|eukprot:XP_001311872.1 ankyrin repeat protein [Trichomonas vaginalis G3]